MTARITPMPFVAAILQAYRRYGVDPAPALKQAQIAPETVKDKTARITARQMEAVSAHAMHELDDEALGWFARKLPWGSYGMLARASITSPNLGVALRRWCRHHALLTQDVGFALSASGNTATLAITPHKDLGSQRELCLVYLLRNAHGLASWFIDSRIALRGAGFPFAAPAHADVYAELFDGAPVKFADTATAYIQFDAMYLKEPLRRDEAALRQMLRRALPIVVMPYRRDRLVVQRVRQVMGANPGAGHTAESLAGALNMSARTLHRQLKEEGASLQALKNEVRLEKAKDLLLRTGKPVKQVAAAAGFRNEKSFVKAFRGWAGVTPGSMRGPH